MIICPNCGTQLADGTRFCSKCGSRLPEAAAPQMPAEPQVSAEPIIRKAAKEKNAAPKLKLNPKLIAIAAAAIALIVLLIIFIPKIFAGGGGSSGGVKDYVVARFDGEKYTGFSKSGKVVTQNIEDNIDDADISNDGKLFAFSTTAGELWTFDGSSFKKIAEDVKEFEMAPFGGGIAYVDNDDALFLYNGKAKKVQDEITDYSCISPDGKAVAFTVEGDESTKAYLYDGKVQELGKDIYPVALSDGGKYVYLRRETSNGTGYYVQKGTNSDSRQKLGDSLKNAVYNTSGTQIVYNDGNKTYFCENGGERQSISSNSLKLLLPGSAYMSNSYAVSNLKNQFYTFSGDSGTNVSFLTGKLELESRMKNVSRASLQSDGKTLIYSKNDNVYTANISKESPEGTKLIDSPKSYTVSYDGKTILYLDEDRVTYTMKTSGGKATKVSEDAYSDATACGSGFLYIMDDELFFTTGGKGSKVSGLSDDVDDIAGTPLYALIYCEDGTIFLTTNGKSLKKVYTEN